jgi:hypothetical protein
VEHRLFSGPNAGVCIGYQPTTIHPRPPISFDICFQNSNSKLRVEAMIIPFSSNIKLRAIYLLTPSGFVSVWNWMSQSSDDSRTNPLACHVSSIFICGDIFRLSSKMPNDVPKIHYNISRGSTYLPWRLPASALGRCRHTTTTKRPVLVESN